MISISLSKSSIKLMFVKRLILELHLIVGIQKYLRSILLQLEIVWLCYILNRNTILCVNLRSHNLIILIKKRRCSENWLLGLNLNYLLSQLWLEVSILRLLRILSSLFTDHVHNSCISIGWVLYYFIDQCLSNLGLCLY